MDAHHNRIPNLSIKPYTLTSFSKLSTKALLWVNLHPNIVGGRIELQQHALIDEFEQKRAGTRRLNKYSTSLVCHSSILNFLCRIPNLPVDGHHNRIPSLPVDLYTLASLLRFSSKELLCVNLHVDKSTL